MHIASLVLGIVSLLASWIPVWGFVLAIVALVIAIIAMVSKKAEEKGKGMKIAGIILSIIATVIALIITVSSVLLMKAAFDIVGTGKELIDDATQDMVTDATNSMNQFVDDFEDIVEDTADEMEDAIDSVEENISGLNNHTILDVTKLDGAKCLNATGMSYEYSTSKHNHGVYVLIKNNKVFFGVNNNELGEDNIKIEKYKDYEITGINAQDISEIYVSGWGQAVNFPAVYFLMKDGSIVWLNSEDVISNNDFAVEGKIPNVENVVRIVNAYASDGFGGGSTIVGLKSDGTFYDLCLETVNKQ